jgi:threonine/homoserine/homoserine lactone efflux protein
MDTPLLYFFVGFVACLLGTIPFGPINLTVVKTTVDHDARRGTEIAIAASLIEILEALIAIWFGMVISSFLESNLAIKLGIGLLFVILAVVVATRESKPAMVDKPPGQESFFKKGLLIAALNPQAVPFWIFALAAISQYFEFEYMGITLAAFLAGVFLGKMTALYGFVLASAYLKTHLQESSALVNKVLASVLLFIGVTQIWNALAQ